LDLISLLCPQKAEQISTGFRKARWLYHPSVASMMFCEEKKKKKRKQAWNLLPQDHNDKWLRDKTQRK
jgi:hypothetical protein